MISPGKMYGISPGRSAKTGWRNGGFFRESWRLGLNMTEPARLDMKSPHWDMHIYSWVLINIICDYIKDTNKMYISCI
jgi:hypothetical protein